MIIAIPLEDGKLCSHFGHCASFALVHTDDHNAITERHDIQAPPHEPGLLPQWLFEKGVNLLLCGGIGPRAIELLVKNKIEVITGAPINTPEALIAMHFQGTLQTSENSCNHE